MTGSHNHWESVLTLNANRKRVDGSTERLADAIRRGADLRIYTEFRYDEHIETDSDNDEVVEEVSEFRVTYLLDDRWVAGIMNLRQPILPPAGFGPRPSMSLFLYNQDGQQAIARLLLDGPPSMGAPGPAPVEDFSDMPKYRALDNWDVATNAPSHNFVYEFGVFRYCVRDDWQEALAHTSEGEVLSGSFKTLIDAFRTGAEIKLGIRGLCNDLIDDGSDAMDHEVFVQAGPGYHQTRQQLFTAGSHPTVRVGPAIPLQYKSKNWDCAWLMARTDGFVARWLVDPYTLKFSKSEARYALRWFVR